MNINHEWYRKVYCRHFDVLMNMVMTKGTFKASLKRVYFLFIWLKEILIVHDEFKVHKIEEVHRAWIVHVLICHFPICSANIDVLKIYSFMF